MSNRLERARRTVGDDLGSSDGVVVPTSLGEVLQHLRHSPEMQLWGGRYVVAAATGRCAPTPPDHRAPRGTGTAPGRPDGAPRRDRLDRSRRSASRSGEALSSRRCGRCGAASRTTGDQKSRNSRRSGRYRRDNPPGYRGASADRHRRRASAPGKLPLDLPGTVPGSLGGDSNFPGGDDHPTAHPPQNVDALDDPHLGHPLSGGSDVPHAGRGGIHDQVGDRRVSICPRHRRAPPHPPAGGGDGSRWTCRTTYRERPPDGAGDAPGESLLRK
jgi:hypothetical protein